MAIIVGFKTSCSNSIHVINQTNMSNNHTRKKLKYDYTKNHTLNLG